MPSRDSNTAITPEFSTCCPSTGPTVSISVPWASNLPNLASRAATKAVRFSADKSCDRMAMICRSWALESTSNNWTAAPPKSCSFSTARTSASSTGFWHWGWAPVAGQSSCSCRRVPPTKSSPNFRGVPKLTMQPITAIAPATVKARDSDHHNRLFSIIFRFIALADSGGQVEGGEGGR